MTFHWPYVLLALPVALAVLLTLFARSHRARQRLLAQFAAARLLPALLASYSPGLRRLKHLLVITGVLLVVVALARPQWGYEWQEQRARGVDVIFVVDTSKSMLTQDVPPSRLERAKLAIMDLVEKMPGNRVGLVAFAGQAFLQCPLTLDYDAFRQSLEAIDTNTIVRGGTNIAAGLDEAASALESSGNHKIIVLLSDGEDLEGDGVSTAKTLHDQGVIIYTVGVGTPQGDIIPLPTKDGQVDFVRDDHGQIVKSHLDAATLTAIANSTGGFYQPLGSTGEGLNQVYEAGIKTIPEQQIASREQRLPLERFQWPLAAGLLLLALELLIGTRRPFRTEERPRSSPPIPAPKSKSAARETGPVGAALVLAAVCVLAAPRAKADDSAAPLSPSDSPAQTLSPPSAAVQPPVLPSPALAAGTAPPPPAPGLSPEVAEQLYHQGNYKAAASAYGQAADQAPEDARFRYDQGASLYHSGDYDGAAHAFEQTLPANDLSLQQRAYYGLGDSRYRLGQAQRKEDPKKTVTTWESAVKDYQNALELNPNDADAHYNLDLLKTQLEQLKKQLEQQQKQQQQQQQQQNQQNQQDNKQDQQNQPDQKNQQGQQGQQNQQNQQGQQGQQDQKNQSGQQGQQNQQQQQQNGGQQPQQSNNPGSSGASQENQQNQNQASGQNPQKNQPQPGQDQKQNQGQSPQPSQNQTPGQNGDQKQPQPQPGSGDKPQSNNQNQPSNSGQQPQPSPQPQPKGTEPTAAKPGQSSGNSTATAGAAGTSTDKNGENGADAVTGPGVMTREEARQVLDSLKNSERKLPVNSYDSQKEGAQSSDQTFKDW